MARADAAPAARRARVRPVRTRSRRPAAPTRDAACAGSRNPARAARTPAACSTTPRGGAAKPPAAGPARRVGRAAGVAVASRAADSARPRSAARPSRHFACAGTATPRAARSTRRRSSRTSGTDPRDGASAHRHGPRPVVFCPAVQTAECIDGVATVTFPDPTATDDCDLASLACVPPSGSVFDLGDTTVTCTATDTSANTDECTLNVAVVDTIPPEVTVLGAGELRSPNHQW
jgi:hypothetical protein